MNPIPGTLTEWILCPRCRGRVATKELMPTHRCNPRKLSRAKPRKPSFPTKESPDRLRRNKADLKRRFRSKPEESVPEESDYEQPNDIPDDIPHDFDNNVDLSDIVLGDSKVDLSEISTDAKEEDKTDEEGVYRADPDPYDVDNTKIALSDIVDSKLDLSEISADAKEEDETYQEDVYLAETDPFSPSPNFDPPSPPIGSPESETERIIVIAPRPEPQFDLNSDSNSGMDVWLPIVKSLDIIISARQNFGSFMEIWGPHIMPYHLIIVCEDSSASIEIPEGFDYEIYNQSDVRSVLGSKAGCISFQDSACRSFGFLVSKKPYVLTIDPDCVVAHDPQGKEINILEQHIQNLLSPSTPVIFNTLYDPYEDGSDFVSGYPFSLRAGVPTAISHGLWLNVIDRDAPTQLVRPLVRNTRYVDAVITIPEGTLFPMSGMNLSFNRDLIGPAMYFGLMGEGWPIGRYGELWAGWCSKVIADHLGYGVKSGLPYVCNSKVMDPHPNLEKEVKGLAWQEDVIPFFKNVLLPVDATTVQMCYRALAKQVEEKLGPLDKYFLKLAESMVTWIECWEELNLTTRAAVVRTLNE